MKKIPKQFIFANPISLPLVRRKSSVTNTPRADKTFLKGDWLQSSAALPSLPCKSPTTAAFSAGHSVWQWHLISHVLLF